MKLDHVKRLKELELENARLRKAVTAVQVARWCSHGCRSCASGRGSWRRHHPRRRCPPWGEKLFCEAQAAKDPRAVGRLWLQGGNLQQARHFSLYTALQLKARMEGIPVSVYRAD